MQRRSPRPASLHQISLGTSGEPPRSGFTHLRRALLDGERIPAAPSLAQQLRQIVQARNLREEQNRLTLEDIEVIEALEDMRDSLA